MSETMPIAGTEEAAEGTLQGDKISLPKALLKELSNDALRRLGFVKKKAGNPFGQKRILIAKTLQQVTLAHPGEDLTQKRIVDEAILLLWLEHKLKVRRVYVAQIYQCTEWRSWTEGTDLEMNEKGRALLKKQREAYHRHMAKKKTDKLQIDIPF